MLRRLCRIDDPAPLAALAAQHAAEILIVLGWRPLPHGPGIDRWQIGDVI